MNSTAPKKFLPQLKNKAWGFAAVASVGALALSACGDRADNTPGGGGDDDKGEITMGIFNGWEEGIAVSELWAVILEDEGYTVNKQYVDLAPGYTGVANGDLDFIMDVWQPVTHAEYLEEYGDNMEKLSEWNTDAVQVIAVNADAPVDSLEELADHADEFDQRLVGIEPGAGLTERTEKYLIPEYGLEDWDFKTSSTPAMLQELKSSLEAGDNIAVTLWTPHWAFSSMDIKTLEDPKETLGQEEKMTSYGRKGFVEDEPEVGKWMQNFEIDTETLEDLEQDLFETGAEASEYEQIIRDWIKENQDYVDSLTE